jgi:hypothetical protein
MLGIVFIGVYLNAMVAVALLTGVFIFVPAFLLLLLHRPGLILISYIVLLPFYIMTMALLYQVTGSVSLINLVQPWKEALALLLLFLTGILAILRMRISQLHPLDIFVTAYFGLNLLYLIVPWGPDLSVRLYGIRSNAFFVVIYWLGRFVVLDQRMQRLVFASLIAIGVAAAVFVLIEIVFLPMTWPQAIGYSQYQMDFHNQPPRGHYGLTWTFETSTGLRRRSAFFSNPLELASSTLITGVAALYLMLESRPKTVGRVVGIISWFLIALSMLLSISRASMMAFVIQTVVAAYWLGKKRFVLGFLALMLLGSIVIVGYAGEQIMEFAVETITFSNLSSQGHLEEWRQGLVSITAHPLGIGLGSSGQTGARFGSKIGGENQYMIVAVQLGFLGLILYASILIGVILIALRAFHRAEGITRALLFVTAASIFGLLMPRFTTHIENYIFAMFVTWWLAGFAVQQYVVQHKRRIDVAEENTNAYSN